MSKIRLDQRVFDLGLCESRERAKTTIMSGLVYVDGQKADKPGTPVGEDAKIEVRGSACPYVSRGGFKLEKALKEFPVEPAGKTCIDCGASTGGFTDVLLARGAARVVGLDVGHGQLHPRLRADARVTALEGVNARHLVAADLGAACPAEGFGFITGDLSFISLALVLPALAPLLAPAGDLLMLVKPQFELQPGDIGKGGLVKDTAALARVEPKLREAAAGCGLAVAAWLDSPVTGGDGNREFLMHARRAG